MSTLEHFVLSKPYFQREGISIATADGQVVGFSHAGFGPSEDRLSVDSSTGIICTVQTLPDWRNLETYNALIRSAEAFLKSRHATSIVAGPVESYECFYHGLSSLGESTGVPQPDLLLHDAFHAAGYKASEHNVALRRDLVQFRFPFDRKIRMLQRQHEVIVDLETDLTDWWELCRFGPMPRCGFNLVDRQSRSQIARVLWWDLGFSGASPQSAVAFTNLWVAEPKRRQGFGSLMMYDAMKQLKASGASFATARVNVNDEVGLAFFKSLGFEEMSRGATYSK